MKLSSLLLSVASLTTLAFAIPNPIPGSSNIQLRDPAIAYNAASKKYFVFSTGKGIRTYTATSLTGPWTAVGSVLPNCTVITDIPISGCSLWAPDVRLVNGRYTLYYSVSQLSTQNSAIGVATSPTMEPGSWTDHGAVVRSKKGDSYNAIDGNVVLDNGKLKLGFGSYWGGIFQVDLKAINKTSQSPPGTHLAGGTAAPRRAASPTSPWARPTGSSSSPTATPPSPAYVSPFPPSSPSSPFLFLSSSSLSPLSPVLTYLCLCVSCVLQEKTRVAAGREYKVRVGRAKSSSGPFLDGSGHAITAGTTSGWNILGSHDNVYAPGGQSLFRDPVSRRDVIVYHYVRMDEVGGASYLGINYVDFSSGEPVLVN
ncbi:hypothetical protein GSI_03412 [Ganoderma sinense ZZ0214-1]|uniref:Endo-1,5-alpha-L-arabinanase A n=1 Tax=Ganoderma sinense ZZ0214-1 TaxID=1077348 RepID=A0A2G8SLM9_9APHY|nr:hypothetical protein GSI_03412 [Ganoderma sinense ZZ0214-1]